MVSLVIIAKACDTFVKGMFIFGTLYQKLYEFTVQTIYVIFRVKASVHNKFGLTKSKYVKVLQKMFNRFEILLSACSSLSQKY